MIDDPKPRGAAFNMALDEALLRTIHRPLLRFYRWERPAASFGYFEPFAGVARSGQGRELVRRWTGGGIVLHGNDLTYSLIVPREHELARLSISASYGVFHAIVVRALGRSGVVATLARNGHGEQSAGCFEKTVEFDVVCGSRKVAGAAQRRARAGLLHQGSIQNVALPEEFTTVLAQEMASRIEEQSIREADVTVALALQQAKYATDEWLHKF